jgi:hypothetical protein
MVDGFSRRNRLRDDTLLYRLSIEIVPAVLAQAVTTKAPPFRAPRSPGKDSLLVGHKE